MNTGAPLVTHRNFPSDMPKYTWTQNVFRSSSSSSPSSSSSSSSRLSHRVEYSTAGHLAC